MVTRRKTLNLDGTSQPEDEPVHSNSWNRCCAWGCPMPGVWSDSTTPDPNKETKWQCSVHVALEPSQWQTATSMLKSDLMTARLEAAREAIANRQDQTLWRAIILVVIKETREQEAAQPRLTARATPQEHVRLAKDLLTKDLPAIRQPGEDDE